MGCQRYYEKDMTAKKPTADNEKDDYFIKAGRKHGELCVNTFVDLIKNSKSDLVRLNAATTLTAYGYGRPPVIKEDDDDDGSININVVHKLAEQPVKAIEHKVEVDGD